MSQRRGHSGTSLGGVETTPSRRKRDARRRRDEEARWAALAGPVEVRAVPASHGHDVDQGVNDQAGR
jgi:hypothetical protein